MEVWKDVIGYEGLYQVSNLGQVRSLERYQEDRNGRAVYHKGKTLKPKPNSRGYLRVHLRATNKKERFFVHRLVAMHFVENPYPETNLIVNHLDSNHLNNKSDNLEWTTLRGNSQHALSKGRLKRTKVWIDNLNKGLSKHYKPVAGYDRKTGKRVISFKSVNEAGRNGFTAGSVCNCCKGKRQTHKGLVWRYE